MFIANIQFIANYYGDISQTYIVNSNNLEHTIKKIKKRLKKDYGASAQDYQIALINQLNNCELIP